MTDLPSPLLPIESLQAQGRHEDALLMAEVAFAYYGEDPELCAALHHRMAISLDALARHREAASHYAQAIDFALGGLGPDRRGRDEPAARYAAA
jgi:hypothetical protein